MIDTRSLSRPYFERQIEQAASAYEDSLLPPFFKTLKNYVGCGNAQFDCPGHQGGAYFRKHPAGRIFMISMEKIPSAATSATPT